MRKELQNKEIARGSALSTYPHRTQKRKIKINVATSSVLSTSHQANKKTKETKNNEVASGSTHLPSENSKTNNKRCR